MARLVFETGKQKQFLESVMNRLEFNTSRLGQMVGISGRSMQRWLNEEVLGNKTGLEMLSKLSELPLPKIIELRDEFWGNKLSNNPSDKRVLFNRTPGSLDGRRKGGKVSQQRRRDYPDYYASLGCPISRKFEFPKKPNILLAEFIGIVLGDGCITYDQVRITLNSIKDLAYSRYVAGLIDKIFHYKASIIKRKDENVLAVTITGIDLIDKLLAFGMKKGNKVRHQVCVPQPIATNKELSRWCMRGLMDTDGGIFLHKYQIKGKKYGYLTTEFTNMSRPLLRFVYNTLCLYGFHPKWREPKRIWLYSQKETRKYIELIGSSNHRLYSQVE